MESEKDYLFKIIDNNLYIRLADPTGEEYIWNKESGREHEVAFFGYEIDDEIVFMTKAVVDSITNDRLDTIIKHLKTQVPKHALRH